MRGSARCASCQRLLLCCSVRTGRSYVLLRLLCLYAPRYGRVPRTLVPASTRSDEHTGSRFRLLLALTAGWFSAPPRTQAPVSGSGNLKPIGSVL